IVTRSSAPHSGHCSQPQRQLSCATATQSESERIRRTLGKICEAECLSRLILFGEGSLRRSLTELGAQGRLRGDASDSERSDPVAAKGRCRGPAAVHPQSLRHCCINE